MSDWIGLGVILLLAVAAFLGLARLGAPPEEITSEEFERRVEEARGTTRAGAAAGLYALQKLMNPRAAEAVEVLKDLKAGHYNKKQEQGDGDPPEGEGASGGEDSEAKAKAEGEGTDA